MWYTSWKILDNKLDKIIRLNVYNEKATSDSMIQFNKFGFHVQQKQVFTYVFATIEHMSPRHEMHHLVGDRHVLIKV